MVVMTVLMTCLTKSSPCAKHNEDSLGGMYAYNSAWVVAAGLVGQGAEPFPSSLSGGSRLLKQFLVNLSLRKVIINIMCFSCSQLISNYKLTNEFQFKM